MSRLMVPKTLWEKAESLSGLGLNERAWRPTDAVEVLALLKPTGIAVLGGDVYVNRGGQFEPTYENWYAERVPQESPSAFATRSVSIALDYLAKMPEADERWVTLVLSEPAEVDDIPVE